jgi:hypothetical protein
VLFATSTHGVLEYWNNGVLERNSGWRLFDFYLNTAFIKSDPFPIPHQSITPILHHSTLFLFWQSQFALTWLKKPGFQNWKNRLASYILRMNA